MKTLDFKLRYLLRKMSEPDDASLRVVLEFRGDLSALESLGFRPVTTAGQIATGTIPVNRLTLLATHPNVITVEGSSAFKDETEGNLTAINLVAPATARRTVPGLGRGVLIGFIDSGFDLTHPCFCDDTGRTRIVAAWDQVNLAGTQGTPPAGLDYGVEYRQELIAEHLSERRPLTLRNHAAAGLHGTQVAGIAAGRAVSQIAPEGIAPEAELVFVTYRNDTPIGGSAFIIDAIGYILEQARARRRPAVVNLSQGDNLGAHDGSSLLEKAIDFYVEREGVLIVNSAGNEREAQHHARGRVSEGTDHRLPFEVGAEAGASVFDDDIIDIWYYAEDRFEAALRTAMGWQSAFVSPDTESFISLDDGNRVYIASETKHSANGHNRISLIFERGSAWKPGRNELILRGRVVRRGDFDAWADRPNGVTPISFINHTDDCTVTIPGTARHIITISGFVPKTACGLSAGSLAPLTSLGPTRDGRLKPDLTAPGFSIMAPTTSSAADHARPRYEAAHGTSMAAPHVSGVIALLLAHNPALTATEVKQVLLSTARTDTFTGVVPNHSWGGGKLDAGAAYEALSKINEGRGGTGQSCLKRESTRYHWRFKGRPVPRARP